MPAKMVAWSFTFLVLLWAINVVGCSRARPIVEALNEEMGPQPELSPALFKRNQPRITQVFSWNGQIIVAAERYYVVDVKAADATPLVLPDVKAVVGLATRGRDQPLALCRTEAGLALLAKKGDGWDRQLLPDEVQKPAEPFVLLADADSVVLINQDQCFRCTDRDWMPVALDKRPEPGLFRSGWADHHLLTGMILYEGYDGGEWGGSLLALNLKTGKWSEVDFQKEFKARLPIRDLKIDHEGRLWVVEGLAHLGGVQGRLHCRDGKAWKTFASCGDGGRDTAWNLPPSSMDGVAFDADGNPYLLAEDLGVVHHDGTHWTQLTRGWPGGQYVSSFYVTSDGLLVIGMLDAGVLLWDQKANQVRRVNLREPREGDEANPGMGAPGRVRIR